MASLLEITKNPKMTLKDVFYNGSHSIFVGADSADQGRAPDELHKANQARVLERNPKEFAKQFHGMRKSIVRPFQLMSPDDSRITRKVIIKQQIQSLADSGKR